jgi:hypothetical protein
LEFLQPETTAKEFFSLIYYSINSIKRILYLLEEMQLLNLDIIPLFSFTEWSK